MANIWSIIIFEEIQMKKRITIFSMIVVFVGIGLGYYFGIAKLTLSQVFRVTNVEF